MHGELFARNGLSLERLRAFVEIVAAGGPTRAAKGDATRQSQYSRQLKELEHFFGAELFVKRSGRWITTETGSQLQRLINEHLGALGELQRRCKGGSVYVRVGGGESFLQWRLIPRMAELRKRLPDVQFVLLNRRSEDITAGLLSGDIEVGILPETQVPRSLTAGKLPAVKFQLFAPRRLITRSQPITEDNFLTLPIALLEGDGVVRDVLQVEALRRGAVLNAIVECSSHLQLAEIVRHGLAAAALPSEARPLFSSDEVLVHGLSCLEQATRKLRLVWNSPTVRSRPSVLAAIEQLTSTLNDGV